MQARKYLLNINSITLALQLWGRKSTTISLTWKMTFNSMRFAQSYLTQKISTRKGRLKKACPPNIKEWQTLGEI